MKPLEQAEARRLRREEALSIKRIATRLQVSPSSVHAWTRDIALTAEQHEQNLRGRGGPQDPEAVARRAANWRQLNRERRLAYQREGRERARSRDDPLHLAGCMLYWAEGSKGRNTLTLTNSDEALVVFFSRFLRETLGVSRERFRVRLNVYLNNGLSIREVEEHWLRVLDLDRSCLCKHAIDFKPTSSSGRRQNKLPYGVCTVRVNSTRLAQHIFGAIQEYGGFEQPRWVD
jgi:hypothetical protein